MAPTAIGLWHRGHSPPAMGWTGGLLGIRIASRGQWKRWHKRVVGGPSSTGVQQPYVPGAPPRVRPTGVSILAVLYFIDGILTIVSGLLVASLFSFFPALFLICGAVGVVIGLLFFLVGWGLWTLQPWARTAAIILAILGLFNFPIGTVISIIVLIYLFQPEIKAAFGEGPPPIAPGFYPPYGQPYGYPYAPQPGYPQPGYPQQPAQPPWPAQPPAQPTQPGPASGACPNCGSPVDAVVTFCPNCGARVR